MLEDNKKICLKNIKEDFIILKSRIKLQITRYRTRLKSHHSHSNQFRIYHNIITFLIDLTTEIKFNIKNIQKFEQIGDLEEINKNNQNCGCDLSSINPEKYFKDISFKTDHRKTNPKLHMGFVKCAIKQLSEFDRMIEKLDSIPDTNSIILSIKEHILKLTKDHASYSDAREILNIIQEGKIK